MKIPNPSPPVAKSGEEDTSPHHNHVLVDTLCGEEDRELKCDKVNDYTIRRKIITVNHISNNWSRL